MHGYIWDQFLFWSFFFVLWLASCFEKVTNFSSAQVLQGSYLILIFFTLSAILIACIFESASIKDNQVSHKDSRFPTKLECSFFFLKLEEQAAAASSHLWRWIFVSFCGNPLFSSKAPSSWVGLGPCADVRLIPRRVGSLSRIFP